MNDGAKVVRKHHLRLIRGGLYGKEDNVTPEERWKRYRPFHWDRLFWFLAVAVPFVIVVKILT